MILCTGSLLSNGQRIEFEGGPALRFIISLQKRRGGPARTRTITFKEPALSLAAALWVQKNIEREFKHIRIFQA